MRTTIASCCQMQTREENNNNACNNFQIFMEHFLFRSLSASQPHDRSNSVSNEVSTCIVVSFGGHINCFFNFWTKFPYVSCSFDCSRWSSACAHRCFDFSASSSTPHRLVYCFILLFNVSVCVVFSYFSSLSCCFHLWLHKTQCNGNKFMIRFSIMCSHFSSVLFALFLLCIWHRNIGTCQCSESKNKAV